MCHLLLALLACSVVEALTASTRDEDGDGWSAADDCDDNAPGAHPGAPEHCDGVDEDCDGTVDDHAVDGQRGYADRDRDAWGDADAPDRYCAGAPTWAVYPGDCDDADAGTHPGAVESCGTAADDDCDGVANPPDAAGCATWWADADGDGAGGSAEACLCDPTDGWDATGWTDCDDRDPHRTEGCGLAGEHVVDELDVVVSSARRNDSAGERLRAIGDVTGDDRPDLGLFLAPASACNCLLAIASPFESSRDLASSDLIVTPGEGGDVVEVAPATDLDGDGVRELPLLSCAKTTDRLDIHLAPTPAWGEIALGDGEPWITDTLDSACTTFVDVLDDADDDGAPELVVASYGGAWLFERTDTRQVGLEDAAGVLEIEPPCSMFVATPGDLDGDGADDLVLGDYCAEAVYFVFGPETDGASPIAVDRTLSAPGGECGWSLQAVGDLDGDGRDDLLVGGGNAAGEWVQWAIGDPSAAADLPDAAFAAMVGLAGPAAAADLDGDGVPDLALGRFGDDGAIWADEVALVFGPLAGTVDLAVDADARWRGASDGDYAGHSLLSLEDATLDGRPGLWIGAPGSDLAGPDGGAAWFLPGGPR